MTKQKMPVKKMLRPERCLPHAGLRLLSLGLLMASLPGLVQAFSSLSEDELAGVSAQDGLVYELTNPSEISAAEYKLTMTDSAGHAGGIRAAPLRMTPDGNSQLRANIELDVGALAGLPVISIVQQLDRFRLGGATNTTGWQSGLAGDVVRSFGEWALVTDVDFSLSGGPLLGTASNLRLALHDASLFYRQYSDPSNNKNATLTLNNIDFLWETLGGSVSVDSTGLRLAGTTTFRISLDAYYKNHIDQNMTAITANDRPGIRYSWGGTLYDSLLYARAGGVWNTAANQATNVAFNTAGTAMVNMPTGQTQGINLGMRWNYRDPAAPATPGNFLWGIGHITGDQEYLEFGDWKNLEQASGPVTGRYGFDIPLLVYDALSSGSASNAGGSLCWGNTMSGASCSVGGGSLLSHTAGTISGYTADVNRNNGALFMTLLRNGNLLSYSNRVRVMLDPSNPVPQDTAAFGGNADGSGYSWALVATLANINSNIYFYPGGSEAASGSGSRNFGAMGDLLFMSQSFGDWAPSTGTCATNPSHTSCNTTRWSQGTHLMVADTEAQMGIGILGASLLLAADDLRLWLRDTTSSTSVGNMTGGIDLFSPRVRYNLKGLFGGARLPNGHDLIRVANIDMNLEGLLNFRISPSPSNVQPGKTAESNDFLAYSGAMRLRCGSPTPFGCDGNAFADAGGSLTASGAGSYIHIEEPGKPGVYLAFDDLSGDLAISEGVLQLRSATDTDADAAPNSSAKFSTARADLSLSNKVLIGASAASRLTDGVTGAGVGVGGPAGRALTGNLRFGGNDIMSIAIPAASAYYSLTIRAQ